MQTETKQNMGLAVIGLAAVAALVWSMMPRAVAPEIAIANLMLGLVLRFAVGATALCVPTAAVIAVSAFYRYTHRQVAAGASGLFPLVADGPWYNVNPAAAQVAAAYRGATVTLTAPAQVTPALPVTPTVEENEDEFPQQVDLVGMLDETVSLNRLLLGVDGRGQEVTGRMRDLVHVAVGGSSGFGKSVFLRMLTYQLALAQEQPELVLIDLEGVTLAPFAGCDRLLYPLADNEQDAARVLRALADDELNRRKELYAHFPGVDSLERYNAVALEAGREILRPIVAVIDEGTALLGDKGVETALKALTLRARKYGQWVVLAGQDWKASSLDSAIKNQLSTTIQFRAKSAAQSRVLLGVSGAENLPTDPKGRALAQLPGRGLVELQTPYIGRTQLLAGLGKGRARFDLPMDGPVLVEDNEQLPTADRIRLLAAQGLSLRKIQKRVFGNVGGGFYEQVKAALG